MAAKKPKTAKKKTEKLDNSKEARLNSVKKFSDELVKKLGDKVKCVVVWGSVTRGEHTPESDIDTFVLLDDTKLAEDVPPDVKEKIRWKVAELAKKIDPRITLQYFTFLTEFWDDLRHGEPLVIDVLRWGVPIYDVGIFMPAKKLLERGKISSSREAIMRRMSLASAGFKQCEYRLRKTIPFYLEQAMANAGQAPIMLLGSLPPGKEAIGKTLDNLFVKSKMLEKEYADLADEIHEFAKNAEKGKIEVTGQLVEEYIKKTDKFIKRMYKLVGQLGERRKVQDLIETYKLFLKVNVAALKSKGIEPPKKKDDLPKIVKNNLHFKESYLKLFDKWDGLLAKIKENKLKEIKDNEIYELKGETRAFISEIGKELRKKGFEEFKKIYSKKGTEKTSGNKDSKNKSSKNNFSDL